jgi:hypothetical protein
MDASPMNRLLRLPSSQVFGAALFFTLGALIACPDAAAAPPPARTCIKTCKSSRRTCLRIAKRRNTAAIGTCSGSRQAHRGCVKGVRRAFKSARTACRLLLGDCRACCRAGGQGPRCPVGQPIDFTPPVAPDLTQVGLPMAPSGRPIFLSVPGAQLEIDAARKDALTALGSCARWITTCAVAGQTLDDCARSAPPCGTETPWREPVACCAASCFERYQGARRSGTEPIAAFDSVYYSTDPCMPGVADLLRTGRQ